jgi:phosphate transport system substrate-binding protein
MRRRPARTFLCRDFMKPHQPIDNGEKKMKQSSMTFIAALFALAISSGYASVVEDVEIGADGDIPGAAAGSAGQPGAETNRLPPFEPEGAAGRLTLLGDVATVGLAERLADRLVETTSVIGAEARSFATTQGPNWWEFDGQAVAVVLAQPMEQTRLRQFEKTMSYQPMQVRIGLDPLVVVVHQDNPIAERGLTLPELRRVFGPPDVADAVETWGDLGLKDQWAAMPVKPHGPDVSAEVSRGFLGHVLPHAGYGARVARAPGSAQVYELVGRQREAIGYGYYSSLSGGVTAVPLARTADDEPVAPSMQSVYRQTYPMVNEIYLYLKQPPDVALDPRYRELVKLALSRDGQRLLSDAAYIPLPAQALMPQRRKLLDSP